jgi:rubrerythrin
MQPTTTGQNRTGAAVSPGQIDKMLEAVDELSPQTAINTREMDAQRLAYIVEADSVGSIPPLTSVLKGMAKKGIAMLNGVSPPLLLDKMGERIAFERGGVRMYDALISKYMALSEADDDGLSVLEFVVAGSAGRDGDMAGAEAELPLNTLKRIRAEELGHFRLLCESMRELGGDPTAQTPGADVAATATMGVIQVVTDPRTTLAQCLDAALIAELADNASWELLSELAAKAGQGDMSERFLGALAAEEQHLEIIRTWLRALTFDQFGSNAV